MKNEWESIRAIELTQGKFTVVNEDDYDLINQNNWVAAYTPSIKGYYGKSCTYIGQVDGKKKNKVLTLHRVIMEGVLGRKLKRSEIIDHINHDPLDNRRENLRVVSQRQNCQNKKRKFTSKYPGVYWHKQRNKWRAQSQINGKKTHIGYFTDENEAAKAYEQFCRQMVGEELVCKKGEVCE